MLIWSVWSAGKRIMEDANDGKYSFDFCGVIFYAQFSNEQSDTKLLKINQLQSAISGSHTKFSHDLIHVLL